jgi:hypothetical protein
MTRFGFVSKIRSGTETALGIPLGMLGGVLFLQQLQSGVFILPQLLLDVVPIRQFRVGGGFLALVDGGEEGTSCG